MSWTQILVRSELANLHYWYQTDEYRNIPSPCLSFKGLRALFCYTNLPNSHCVSAKIWNYGERVSSDDINKYIFFDRYIWQLE